MAGISGLGTTFNLPNFVGELFALSREDTPFLSAIGGLTGGRAADATLFPWTAYDLRTPGDRTRVEGDDAQTAEARVRSTIYNVVEVHQETVEISYTKLAAVGQFNSTGSTHAGSVGVNGVNAVQDEMSWQLQQMIKQVAQDVNWSFINQTFANPASNATARKTRGLREAIVTNVVDASGEALDDADYEFVDDAMQLAWDSGGIREGATRTLLTNSIQKRALTRYYKSKGYEIVPASRNVGGVAVDTIVTDFGTLNIMLEPVMPQDEILIVDLAECAPRFLPIPGKGHFFIEPLAKTGATERSQLYGEIGLEYGIEKHHAKITNLDTGQGS